MKDILGCRVVKNAAKGCLECLHLENTDQSYRYNEAGETHRTVHRILRVIGSYCHRHLDILLFWVAVARRRLWYVNDGPGGRVLVFILAVSMNRGS